MPAIMEIASLLLLSACLLIEASPGSSSPQILLPPEDTFPSEGNLEFACKGTGFPEPQISWFDAKTGKPLDGTASNIHINQYLGRLTIADPQVKQIYSVYCNISNKAGWTASSVVHGGLAFLEHDFPKFPIDRTAEEGDLVLLECQPPKGNPTPTIEWIFNNDELPPGGGSISPEGDLHIREVKPQHAGTYACRARNIAGERLSPFAVLQIKRKAVRFIQKPKDTQATVGSSVTFRCQVSDSKPVSWRREKGEPIFDPLRVQLSATSMTIRNVQISDAGVYVCVSADGSSAAEARLTITAASKSVFSKFPTDRNATEGETVMFPCRASGSYKFSPSWDLPNQMAVFPKDHIGNIFVNEHGDLYIRGVRLRDGGIYQCTVDSELGLITRKAVLRVFPRSAFKDATPLPPIINLPPANQTRLTGDTVILDCEVGIPREPEAGFDFMDRDFELRQSNIFWVRGTRSTGGLQERIEFVHHDRDPRFTLTAGGGLRIDTVMVEDTGNYTCIFQTNNGPYMQSNWTSSLLVLPPDSQLSLVTEPMDPLSPPENLRVQNQTVKSVTLMWNPPNVHDANQVSYWIEVFHTLESELGWQVLQESWPRNAIRLEPLQPDSAYYFLIRPRWIGGRVGWASAPLGPIQMQYGLDQKSTGTPAIRTRRMQTQVTSSTSARVEWSLENPLEAISAVTSFSVRYKEVPLSQCVSASLHDATFCSLRSGEAVKRRLQIYQQQLNTASLRDTQGVSLVPHEEPEIITDVPVNLNRDFESSWSTTLTHLKPFRCYSLLVQPNAIYPRQSENETILFLTHEDVPSTPPQITGVKKKSNHSVEISWAVPPADSWNGLLTGFVVYVFNAAQNDKRELKLNYGDITGVVGGLKAGEIYHLQMTAVNCRGSSSKSIPINFSVSEGGIISESSPSGESNSGFTHLQPWVIGIVIAVLAIWLMVMFFAVIFCLRQKIQVKQRFPASGGDGFSEDMTRKCSGAATSKEAYNLIPLGKPHSISDGTSDMECPHGSDSALKAPTTSTQQNTTTTIASTNSSSTGGSCNPNMNHVQHAFEEGIAPHHSDFSPSSYFSHIPAQRMEYPFVDYRPAEISNSSVFSASLVENSPKIVTGLPLVAPVAQLACQNGKVSPLDNLSSSVTPYATASLINAEVQQKTMSPESRTPSDMSSNAGGSGHLPMLVMHSPQRYSVRQQQYLSRSSSGTTTGAEDDYLSHQQHQQHTSRRKTVPSNIPPSNQIPPTFAGYELYIAAPTPPPPPPPMHQHPISAQVSANGGVHTPVF